MKPKKINFGFFVIILAVFFSSTSILIAQKDPKDPPEPKPHDSPSPPNKVSVDLLKYVI